MKMCLSFITFAALAAAVPYPLANSTLDALALTRAAGSGAGSTSSCQTAGDVLCNGAQLIGECDIDKKVVWMSVAAGTICHCASTGDCYQVASENGRSGSSPEPAPSHVVSSGTTPPAYTSSTSQTSSAPAASASSGGNRYVVYSGDGSIQAGWPSQSNWLSFDDLWKGYEPIIGTGCENLPTSVPNNKPEDTANLREALLTESKRGGMPPSFALAIMMQESTGCVYVSTTAGSHKNPGLFQSYDGTGTCYEQNACPKEKIEQMARDGICGTVKGNGLQQDANLPPASNSTGAQKWSQTARIYNAGSVPGNMNLNAPGATPCYVMDVANRLVGQWFSGNSLCTLDSWG